MAAGRRRTGASRSPQYCLRESLKMVIPHTEEMRQGAPVEGRRQGQARLCRGPLRGCVAALSGARKAVGVQGRRCVARRKMLAHPGGWTYPTHPTHPTQTLKTPRIHRRSSLRRMKTAIRRDSDRHPTSGPQKPSKIKALSASASGCRGCPGWSHPPRADNFPRGASAAADPTATAQVPDHDPRRTLARRLPTRRSSAIRPRSTSPSPM